MAESPSRDYFDTSDPTSLGDVNEAPVTKLPPSNEPTILPQMSAVPSASPTAVPAGSSRKSSTTQASQVRSASRSARSASQFSVPGYSVIREISRGGQAVVFEALQQSTGRKVAIKVLKEGAFATAEAKVRMDREVQVLAALNHPDIVQILDRGTTPEGAIYLVMEYISGRALDEYLVVYAERHPDKSDDPSGLLHLFMRIADAVNAAHLRGVVHRDLKPGNIRVDDEGNPHILDFGLARSGLGGKEQNEGQPITITGQFLGSLPWASPEQADGMADRIDVRTDVYSLGVILYQMLTGAFPYEVVGTMRDVLNNILTAQPMPPSQVLAARDAKAMTEARRIKLKRSQKVNPVIEAIVLKALSKRREDRYQTAGELARDIANYLSGRPTSAAGAPSALQWRPVALGISALAACVLVALTTWYITRQRGAKLSDSAVTAVVPDVGRTASTAGNPVAPLPPAVITAPTPPPRSVPVEIIPKTPSAIVPPAAPLTGPLIRRAGDVAIICGTDGDDLIELHASPTGDLVAKRGEEIASIPAAGLARCILQSGGGTDRIDLALPGTVDLEVDNGSGTKTVHIGANGTFAGFKGTISIKGGGGPCHVELDDRNNATDTTYLIDGDTITSTRAGAVKLAGVSDVTIQGGKAWATGYTPNRTFCILATPAGTSFQLNGGEGACRVFVGSESSTQKGDISKVLGPVSIAFAGEYSGLDIVDTLRTAPLTYRFDGSDFQCENMPPIHIDGHVWWTAELNIGTTPCTFLVDGAPRGGVAIFGNPAGNCHVVVSKRTGKIKSLGGGVNFSCGGNVEVYDQDAGAGQQYVLSEKRMQVLPTDVGVVLNYPDAATITLHANGGGSIKAEGPAANRPRVKVVAPVEFKIDTTVGEGNRVTRETDAKLSDPAGRQSSVNSIGIKLFRIEAGEFSMGNASTTDSSKFAPKAHQVTISAPFWMGAGEVTVGQWKLFVSDTNYVTAEEKDPGQPNWQKPGWKNTDEIPVTGIDWEGAVAFCDWLGKREGKHYRLPSEAEWEYACRAGTTGDLPTNGPMTSDDAVFGPGGPVPSAVLRPNAWGLRGMIGNVNEWCSDWVDAYPTGPVVDPTGPDHQTGIVANGEGKVCRGGSTGSNPGSFMSWTRGWSATAYGGGFRVVMDEPKTH